MKKIPINEIFGPTIQGEGPLVGSVTHFVRTNGCDYRCIWCDTPDAVYPDLIKQHNTLMTAGEIAEALLKLPPASVITYSGGNPCIHDALGEVIIQPALKGFLHAVETQGTYAPNWLEALDYIIVSPKPPSAGTPQDLHTLTNFLDQCERFDKKGCTAIKIVIFDEVDLAYAKDVVRCFAEDFDIYLQVGCQGKPDLVSLNTRYVWLAEEVLKRSHLSHVKVLPQLHKYLWGHKRGV